MQMWSSRWARYVLLGIFMIALSATIADARRFFRFWWRQPPAPAIENSDYTGDATRGRVRAICVEDGAITVNERVALEDTTFAASVTDGVLTLDPLMLSGSSTVGASTTTSDVVITLDEAELFRTYFSSVFRARGEAVVTTTIDVTDDTVDPPVVTTTTSTATVPVVLFGSIHEHTDEQVYHLRAGVRGFLREEDDATGKLTYTLLRLNLNGQADVPGEEEPLPEVPPAES